MIIQCDQCSARFRLDDNKVTESGVKVRCKRCQHIFLVRKELPQEEPDVEALLQGLQPGTALSQAIPAQKTPPVPEPALPAAAPPEEALPGPQDTDEFSFTVAPSLPETEPTATVPPPDDFSFSFEPEPPGSASPATDLFVTGITSSETAPPDDTRSVSPQPEDFGFSITEDFPSDVTMEIPPPPEPVVETAASEASWDEFEIEISSPQPVATQVPSETDTGSPIVVAASVPPEEKPETSGWDGFDSFEIELPEPGGPPAEPVPGDTVSIPVPALPEEPAEDESFDFSGWTPVESGTAPASSLPTPVPTERGEEPTTPSLAEDSTFGSSYGATPIPPVVSEAPPLAGTPKPTLSAPETREEELPEAPGTITPLYPATGGDTFSFDDMEPTVPPSRRQGPSLIAIVGMVIAALVVLIVGGGGALYLLKGPEALKKVGLGSVARLLGSEKMAQERILIKNLEGSYVNNSEAGELFVIRGEVVNSYRAPRAAIQVRGLIYNAAGSVILQKTSFCGNPLPQDKLTTLPVAKIEEAMNNRLGDSYANIGVPAGKSLPFVIVFSGLPKEAADYGVEVAGSQPAGQ